MENIFKKVSSLYWRYFKDGVSYAKHIGVSVGNNTEIYTKFWSSEPFLITIGNNVQITDNVHFYTHGGGNVIRRQYPDFDAFGKIVVEDYAYIGSGSLILPGVTIGEGALVAAGSVVTKSVPPRVVVGGNPAKVLCTIDDYIVNNMKYNIKTKGLSYEDKIRILKSLPEDRFIKK